MKPSLLIFGLILSCMLVVFIAACEREGDARVGSYTLVRGELEVDGDTLSLDSSDLTGTLTIRSDGTFSMSIGGGPSGSGTWTSTTLITDVGNTVPYSFTGSTIQFTLTVEGINFTYVWQKI